MAGNRITGSGGPIDFTCKNKRFETDISSPVNPKYPGSVTAQPLYDDGSGQILLLERVRDVSNGNKCYWFMWYENGNPMLPLSGVIDENAITQVIKSISTISF